MDVLALNACLKIHVIIISQAEDRQKRIEDEIRKAQEKMKDARAVSSLRVNHFITQLIIAQFRWPFKDPFS